MKQDRFSQPVEREYREPEGRRESQDHCHHCGKRLEECRCDRGPSKTIPVACASPATFFDVAVDIIRTHAALTQETISREEHNRFPRGRW